MRNVSDRNCRKIKTRNFLLNIPPPEDRALYWIRWKNNVEPDRPQMAMWHTHFACWVPKATKTLSEFVNYIAFPRQQWFHERPSVLRYTHVAYHVLFNLNG